MPKLSRPRKGSLQYAPRKRARKILPRVNWNPVETSSGNISGVIGYKAGMASAIVKDVTKKSVTSGKRMYVPVTIVEVPKMKVLAVRFYKNKVPSKDVVVSKDKDLRKKVKLPKEAKSLDKEVPEDYDDVRLLVYSLVKQTSVKKNPDISEIAISGNSKEEKLEKAKSFLNKEISLEDFVESIDNEKNLVDIKGVTKGKGTQGPVKRFGINLRSHKSEKGVRKVGSIGPWHPARVTFRVPMAGQMGFFTRITYNQTILSHGNISEKNINPSKGFSNYGNVKSSYIILFGSVHGPAKRQIMITAPQRPSHSKTKKSYEFVELVI